MVVSLGTQQIEIAGRHWFSLFYNLGQNICRVFHTLAQFLFTTIETEIDFYHQRLKERFASRVAERIKARTLRN